MTVGIIVFGLLAWVLGHGGLPADWPSVKGWNRQMTQYVIALMNNEEASK